MLFRYFASETFALLPKCYPINSSFYYFYSRLLLFSSQEHFLSETFAIQLPGTFPIWDICSPVIPSGCLFVTGDFEEWRLTCPLNCREICFAACCLPNVQSQRPLVKVLWGMDQISNVPFQINSNKAGQDQNKNNSLKPLSLPSASELLRPLRVTI